MGQRDRTGTVDQKLAITSRVSVCTHDISPIRFMPSNSSERPVLDTPGGNRPLQTIVRDDEADDVFSTVQNVQATQAVLPKTSARPRNGQRGDAQGHHTPPLDNLYTSYIESPFRLDLPDPGDHRPWYHLDWSSPVSLRRNQHKLMRSQRWWLQQVYERVKAFPESFARINNAEDDYRTMANMIALAHDRDTNNDLSFKSRLLRCRRIKYETKRGNVYYNGRCFQRRFCPFCNFLLRQEPLLTYVPAFDRGHWYAMTISSTADLDLNQDELTFSWEAGEKVVRALLKAKLFQGAYWTEETHLHSLDPEIRVLPHCHVLFYALGEVSLGAVQALAEETFRAHFKDLDRKAANAGQADSLTLLEPEIDLEGLSTREDLYRWCDYLTKTVRFVDAYRDALDALGDENRWWVNKQFEQFLAGMVLMLEEDSPKKKKKRRETKKKVQQKTTNGKKPKKPWVPWRKQRHSLGALRPGRSGRFIGIRPADRHEHVLDLEQLRREIIAAKATSDEDSDAGDGAAE